MRMSELSEDTYSGKMKVIGMNLFRSIGRKARRTDLKNRKLLIPQMNKIGGHLLAATFRGFGIDAIVMETYKGLDQAKRLMSGKECFPCQVTMGDILYFMKKEKERLGAAFDPDAYVYFMPESDGPCRFGMYNKYQRLVLDSIPRLRSLKLASLTFEDGYALQGMMDDESVKGFRKAGYLSVIVGDVLDRLLWRIRPYERSPGVAESFIEYAMHIMETGFEKYGPSMNLDEIVRILERIIAESKSIIDLDIPSKPLIGVVGEIYLRSHTYANQDIIKKLEQYGAEVVNASIGEWINYASYDRLREAKRGLIYAIRQLSYKKLRQYLNKVIGFGLDLYYQQIRQNQIYRKVKKIIDIASDHHINELEDIVKKDDLFSFDMGTEACLSISSIIKYVREGFNGVVNVYPFTCMPSIVTSAVIKPIMCQLRVPYLDAPYDGSFQPGRETALRTFMYQAYQHYKKNGTRHKKLY